MDLHPDFRDLLGEFVRGNVRFVVLGGYAVGHRLEQGTRLGRLQGGDDIVLVPTSPSLVGARKNR